MGGYEQKYSQSSKIWLLVLDFFSLAPPHIPTGRVMSHVIPGKYFAWLTNDKRYMVRNVWKYEIRLFRLIGSCVFYSQEVSKQESSGAGVDDQILFLQNSRPTFRTYSKNIFIEFKQYLKRVSKTDIERTKDYNLQLLKWK